MLLTTYVLVSISNFISMLHFTHSSTNTSIKYNIIKQLTSATIISYDSVSFASFSTHYGVPITQNNQPSLHSGIHLVGNSTNLGVIHRSQPNVFGMPKVTIHTSQK
ncbi:hypothetical protein F4775DRAFT_475169 [Biscogniauxia sp. FL1348]|nr:hypothetical protein F4775DRAFT_475169 [Biscogniauxia sp. FL1348]